MKKLLPLLTIFAILTIIPRALAFTDVSATHPNFKAIDYVQQQHIVNGYPDGSFKPEKTINRAEFIKILMGAVFNENEITSWSGEDSSQFGDVPGTAWFNHYVHAAHSQHIIEGYSDRTFRPDSAINFAEAAKIITKTFNLKLGTGAQWYEPYVNALGAKGVIPDTINGPDHKITRAEMAEMIYRLKSGNTGPTTTGTAGSAVSASSTGAFATMKDQVIALVNQERAKQGLQPMKYNPLLEKSAQGHSDDMQARDFFAHTNPDGKTEKDRITASGYLDAFNACKSCNASYIVGENIAKGQASAQEVMDTWMNSPAHRANILNPTYSEIGIGVTTIVNKPGENFIGDLWVQNFGDVKLKK